MFKILSKQKINKNVFKKRYHTYLDRSYIFNKETVHMQIVYKFENCSSLYASVYKEIGYKFENYDPLSTNVYKQSEYEFVNNNKSQLDLHDLYLFL